MLRFSVSRISLPCANFQVNIYFYAGLNTEFITVRTRKTLQMIYTTSQKFLNSKICNVFLNKSFQLTKSAFI